MNELKLTGGARIGMVNATFPLATLKVNEDRLELNSLIGNLVFQPSDIISIEPYTMIPLLGQGIKINHRVSTYNKKVIFWILGDPNSVIRQIQETGFLDGINISTQQEEWTIIEKQSQGGFPIKKGFAIGAIIVWNLLFLIDIIPFFQGKTDGLPMGNGTLAALGLLFLTTLLSLTSANFRQLILKEGRELKDIKALAIFILIISGFMLLNLGIITMLLNEVV